MLCLFASWLFVSMSVSCFTLILIDLPYWGFIIFDITTFLATDFKWLVLSWSVALKTFAGFAEPELAFQWLSYRSIASYRWRFFCSDFRVDFNRRFRAHENVISMTTYTFHRTQLSCPKPKTGRPLNYQCTIVSVSRLSR